jgi:outer membrane protein OmpA-like peptidoglycan-associated protein
MNITFYLSGQKNPRSIYVRVRDSVNGLKVNTTKSIDPNHFKNGKITLLKIKQGMAADEKAVIQSKNETLNHLQKDLDNLEFTINNKYNNLKDYETINTKWLKNIISPIKEDIITSELVEYFDVYFQQKQNVIRASTIKKLKVFQNRLKQYQEDEKKTLYIQEINKEVSSHIQKWCDKNNYAHNTKVKTIKVIRTICNHAREHNNKPLNPDIDFILMDLKYINTDNIHLSFDEIQQIIDSEIEDERVQIAKDWLIISCYTAQRVSDNIYLKKKNIVYQNGEYLVDINQQKTGTPIYITLNEEVMKILDKRDGEFPPVFSDNKNSNETMYNKLIKKVCKLSGINELIQGQKKNPKTNRYEYGEHPKYNLVSSHIGRRSFATNYSGLIDVELLRSQTGHSSSAQFYRYVGKTGNQNAIRLAEKMRDVRKELKLLAENEAKKKPQMIISKGA